nr:hypothetical protein [Streptomyces sp. NRRL WC-3549]
MEFVPVGPDDPEVGPPTQMAVFTRTAPDSETAHGKARQETHEKAHGDAHGKTKEAKAA